jgi:hypothetical protein
MNARAPAAQFLLAMALCLLLLTGCSGAAASTSAATGLPSPSSSSAPSAQTPLTNTPAGTTFLAPTPTTAPVPTTTPIPSITNLLSPKALTDITSYERYKGEDGGLYGAGLNIPPPAHYQAALGELSRIKPLDAEGNPSAGGKVVLISIGMSNTTMEFSVFKGLADKDPLKSPFLKIVDGAQGGQTAKIWAEQANPWQVLAQRLQNAGVTPAQVQVVWLKQANAQPSKDFQTEAQTLESQLGTIAGKVKQIYPNVRIVYLSSRIYGGYATTMLNPEPYAYEGAFAVRWLIQSQIAGDPALNYDATKGEVKAPLLLWGPYLWADGMNPNSQGLTWAIDDLRSNDRTHPSDSGSLKVANLLLDFFKTSELARSWFLK